MKKSFTFILVSMLFLLVSCSSGQNESADPVDSITTLTSTVESVTEIPPEDDPAPESSQSLQPEGVLLGIYPSGFIQYYVDDIIQLDAWLASVDKKTAIAATFLDFQDPDLETIVPAEMETSWENGYIPFVNLAVGYVESFSSVEIAQGNLDPDIRRWAQAYAKWSIGGNKRAFIAPLQEMNGGWTAYSGDPENFKLAYRRIQDLFQEEGVDPDAVSWVFAPNGWSRPGNEFELYYPGDDVVDVVGFSSYNFGDCSTWPKWEVYEDIYKPYLDRMSEMAPDKPIFIAEMGTVAEGGDKNTWLKNTHQQLALYPNLHGILYFNRVENAPSLKCPQGTDYRFYYVDSGEGYPGYLEGITSPEIIYYSPDSQEMTEIMFSRP